MKKPKYQYRATIVKVVDGDTVDVAADLGMHTIRVERLRLYGINAPEVRGRKKLLGLKSKQWLIDMVACREIIVKTYKDEKGKYGRYLAEIWLDGVNVNELMVKEGLAVKAEY